MKISDGCIALIRDSEEVDDLKYEHEQESLRQKLWDIKLANQNIKNVLHGVTN